MLARSRVTAVEDPLAHAFDQDDVRDIEHGAIEPAVDAGDRRGLQIFPGAEVSLPGRHLRRQEIEQTLERYRAHVPVRDQGRSLAQLQTLDIVILDSQL